MPVFRTYGIPSIRADLPAPRLRRLNDMLNYGDESSAYGLTNPSIYSQHGVYEKELLIPRTSEEVRHPCKFALMSLNKLPFVIAIPMHS